MIIRTAKIEDSGELLPLMDQLGYAQDISSMQKILRNCIDSGVYYCLVAEVENHIIALVFFIIYPSCYKNSNRCSLEALIVDKHYRRQAIGRKLMNAVEELALENNCSSISLITNIHRGKEIIEFYNSLGYLNEGRTAQIYLRKPLIFNNK
ncbi:MAG: GNAT family N-acetyltransferase [Candidatus Paracaedibacter sp.]